MTPSKRCVSVCSLVSVCVIYPLLSVCLFVFVLSVCLSACPSLHKSFPSLCFLSVSFEPTASCVKLEEFTEVAISPKLRQSNPSSNPQQKTSSSSDLTENNSQAGDRAINTESNTRNSVLSDVHEGGVSNSAVHSMNSQVSSTEQEQKAIENRTSVTAKVYGYLRTLFYGTDVDNTLREDTGSLETESEITQSQDSTAPDTSIASPCNCWADVLDKEKLDLCLRIQPHCTDERISSQSCEVGRCYFCQPSTVFVHFASLPEDVLKSWCGRMACSPPEDSAIVRIVQIQRLLSPKERVEQTSRNKKNVKDLVESSTLSTQLTPGKVIIKFGSVGS